MRRHRHDGARAVACENIIRNPDGNFFFIRGINRLRALELNPGFLPRCGKPFLFCFMPRCFDVFLDLAAVCDLQRSLCQERMRRRENHVGRAKKRIRPRRENFYRFARSLDGKRERRAFGAADPVPLHRLGLLRPVEPRKIVKEPFGVIGDLKEPLFDLLLHHLRRTPFAAALHYLLVREHRLAGGAPVGRRLFAVREAVLQKLEKEPLIPLVVLGKAGDDEARPVVAVSHRLHLFRHCFDVLQRPVPRMDIALDGRVFRGQAESVKTDGTHHVVSRHAHEARKYVRRREVVPVADVKVARGVRKHHEVVEVFDAGNAVLCLKDASFFPGLLPLFFYRFEIVFHGRS